MVAVAGVPLMGNSVTDLPLLQRHLTPDGGRARGPGQVDRLAGDVLLAHHRQVGLQVLPRQPEGQAGALADLQRRLEAHDALVAPARARDGEGLAAGQGDVRVPVDHEILQEGLAPQAPLRPRLGLERQAVVGGQLQPVVDLDVAVKAVVPEQAEVAVDLARLDGQAAALAAQVVGPVGLLDPGGAREEGAQGALPEARLEVEGEVARPPIEHDVGEEHLDVVLPLRQKRLVVPEDRPTADLERGPGRRSRRRRLRHHRGWLGRGGGGDGVRGGLECAGRDGGEQGGGEERQSDET